MLPLLLIATLARPLQETSSKHIIPAPRGLQMIEAYKAVKAANPQPLPASIQDRDYVAFPIEDLKRFLDQPLAVNVRWYKSISGDHTTLVGVAMDAQGLDIASPTDVVIDDSATCPPVCK